MTDVKFNWQYGAYVMTEEWVNDNTKNYIIWDSDIYVYGTDCIINVSHCYHKIELATFQAVLFLFTDLYTLAFIFIL